MADCDEAAGRLLLTHAEEDGERPSGANYGGLGPSALQLHGPCYSCRSSRASWEHIKRSMGPWGVVGPPDISATR